MVTYLGATNIQAYSVMTASNRCYMPIRMECNNNRIFTPTGAATIQWYEQNFQSVSLNVYFGHASTAECSCGSDNECAGDDGMAAMQARRCNCDIGDNVDRVDAGIFRARSDFPLVGFKALSTPTGSLKIKLGNLYCADNEFDLKVCSTEFHDCHKHATCIGITWNKYDCVCNPGWQGINVPNVWANGRSCYDDNECLGNPCNNIISATCVNTPGSYRCDCNPGFKAIDANTCIDIDECKTNTHNCHPDATCINSYGSFSCSCNRGFAGNGTHCEPIGECTCWGDPHCVLYDDKLYHFYGPCTYIMTRDNCANGLPAGEPTFQVEQINWRQGRTDTRGSWIQAVEIKVYGAVILLDQNKVVSVNGVIISGFSDRPLTAQSHPDLLIIKAGSFVRVTADLGFEVRWDGNTKVDVVVNSAFQGKMCGMCGNFNHNSEDDLVAGPGCAPNTTTGSVVTNTNTFAASWVSGPSRDYSITECSEYCDLPPEDLCETEGIADAAEAECDHIFTLLADCVAEMTPESEAGYRLACKFDLCAGVDVCNFASDMADICSKNYRVTIDNWRSDDFCGNPGCGQNMRYTYCGSICQPTCVYPNGFPNCESDCNSGCFCEEGYVLEGDKCILPEDCGCMHESGMYIPDGSTVLVTCEEECTCSNHTLTCGPHTCPANSTCSVLYGERGCYCDEGFERDPMPDGPCLDIDECSTALSDCHDKATCTNTIPAFDCTCNEGYQGDGVNNCDDVDECLTGENLCDVQTTECKNNEGGYTCLCKIGYERVNETHCQNINECDGANNCDVATTDCEDTDGSYLCNCMLGYVRVDEFSCTDDDECADEAKNDCHENATCSNNAGSFTCTCNIGFVGDGKTCEDFNECENAAYDCEMNEHCRNTIGNYVCDCDDGYTRNAEGVCEDDDECTLGTNNCVNEMVGGVCKNSPGSFDCSCHVGYSGDGVEMADGGSGCTDVNECDENPCEVNEFCINTVGSYDCECKEGFEIQMENGGCENINECEDGSNFCVSSENGGACTDFIGSYGCYCLDGYDGNGFMNGTGCTDVDECALDTDNCAEYSEGVICTNTVGSFECSCEAGFMGDGVDMADGGTGCTGTYDYSST